jgi:hypothetical protein
MLGRKVMTGSMQLQNDRRQSQRYQIRAPLTIIVGEREFSGFTRDLSNHGVYFYLDLSESTPVKDSFDFLVELPPEITLSTCCLIRGQGHLLRTENAQSQLTGMAAEILHYSIQSDGKASA